MGVQLVTGTNSSADSRAATSVNDGRGRVGVPKGDFSSQAGEETGPSGSARRKPSARTGGVRP